jgi:3-oxoacyl-(acyl-carrier-protein) synthase/acyl carrier protein
MAAIADSYNFSYAKVVSSCKTRFGHSESSAGSLGILAILISWTRATCSKILHFRDLNPFIDYNALEKSKILIPLEEIHFVGRVDAAGCSSFGFSGTNSHAILSRPKKASAHDEGSSFAEAIVLSFGDQASFSRVFETFKLALIRSEKGPSFYSTPTMQLKKIAFGTSRQKILDMLELSTSIPSKSKIEWALAFSNLGGKQMILSRKFFESHPDSAFYKHHKEIFLDGKGNTFEQFGKKSVLFLISLGYLCLSWGLKPNFLAGSFLGELCVSVIAKSSSAHDVSRLLSSQSSFKRVTTLHAFERLGDQGKEFGINHFIFQSVDEQITVRTYTEQCFIKSLDFSSPLIMPSVPCFFGSQHNVLTPENLKTAHDDCLNFGSGSFFGFGRCLQKYRVDGVLEIGRSQYLARECIGLSLVRIFDRKSFFPNLMKLHSGEHDRERVRMFQFYYPFEETKLVSDTPTSQDCELYFVLWSVEDPVNIPTTSIDVLGCQESLKRTLMENFSASKVECFFPLKVRDVCTSSILSLHAWRKNSMSTFREARLFLLELQNFDGVVYFVAYSAFTCLNPWSRSIWSMNRCFALESSKISSVLVDLDSLNTNDLLTGCPRLLKRPRSAKTKEEFSIKQNGQIFKATVGATKAISRRRNSFSGTWLVTGGNGGLGKILIDSLPSIENFCLISRRFVFLGCSVGSSVAVFAQADVCKSEDVLLVACAGLQKPIDGGFHLAGSLKDRLFQSLTWEDFKNVMRVKILGLKSLTLIGLKKMILFSSSTSLFGNIGQANYGAANGFLDGFAASMEGVVSINWGPWSEGMFLQVPDSFKNVPTLNPQKMEVFLELVDFTQNEIGIAATGSFNHFQGLAVETSRQVQDFSTTVETRLHHIIRDILELKPETNLSNESTFFELGFDSLLNIELAFRIRKDFEIQTPLTLAYDFPTIRSVIEFLSPKDSKSREITLKEPHVDFVIVVGAACRFRSSSTVNSLFSNFCRQADQVSEIPFARWDWRESLAQGSLSKWGCFVENIGLFDHKFFSMSRREALFLDPQHRMVLECSYECFELANQNPFDLENRGVTVFVGISSSEFGLSIKNFDSPFIETGTLPSTASGRISYFFGFTGECMSIDTACSSSLVALALAFRSVNQGSEFAVALGVQALMHGPVYIALSRSGMLSPDGRCKTFDQSANGYVRGEGCGAILLKRKSDDDLSLARICGSAINQDGRSNGLTAPNGPAQTKLIQSALKKSGLEPSEIGNLEAHGTGTPLGDPIELQAVSNSLGASRISPFLVGSAKTNFGHAEAASGILGVLKAILSVKNRIVFKHLHLKHLNVYIGVSLLEGMKCVVPQENIVWPTPSRKSSISSFGFSGTNAHAILGEGENYFSANSNTFSFLVSAKTEQSLSDMKAKYHEAVVVCCDESALRVFGRMNFGLQASFAGSRKEIKHSLNAFPTVTPSRRLEISSIFLAPTYAFSSTCDVLGKAQESGKYMRVDFENDDVYVLEDHLVFGRFVAPGSVHLTLTFELLATSCSDKLTLSNVEFRKPVIFDDDQDKVVSYTCSEDEVTATKEEVVFLAKFSRVSFIEPEILTGGVYVDAVLDMSGVHWGESFLWAKNAMSTGTAAKCEIRNPVVKTPKFSFPPQMLDSLFRLSNATLFGKNSCFVPFSINEISFLGQIDYQFPCQAKCRVEAERSNGHLIRKANLNLCQFAEAFVAVKTLAYASVGEESFKKKSFDFTDMYEIEWRRSDRPIFHPVSDVDVISRTQSHKQIFAGIFASHFIFHDKFSRLRDSQVSVVLTPIEAIPWKKRLKLMFTLLKSRAKVEFVYLVFKRAFSKLCPCPFSRGLWCFSRVWALESTSSRNVLINLDDSDLSCISNEIGLESQQGEEVSYIRNERRIGKLAKTLIFPQNEYSLSYTAKGSISAFMLCFKISNASPVKTKKIY